VDKGIIVSTHILEEVDAVCNRMIVIGEGRILVDSTPDDLRKNMGGTLEGIFRKLTLPQAKSPVAGGVA
jgi:ABC-2 type transport system ATP-binding protein